MSANKPKTTGEGSGTGDGKMADENMELDERKVKILDAVIRNYLATGEPVGSRTISKYTDLNLSSATIRMRWQILKNLVISCSHIHQQEEFLQTKAIGFMWII